MSVWVSVGPDISTKVYEHSGHRPSLVDPQGPYIDLAYVPDHISKGVWVRLSVADGDGLSSMVLNRRAVTQLRDVLNDILDGPRG